MDKIFHSTFEFFSHALPGAIMAMCLFLFKTTIVSPVDFITELNAFDTPHGVAILVAGYIIGFAVYPIGRYIYKGWGKKRWPENAVLTGNINLFISKKYSLIRQHSPENFRYIEMWNMYCAMSHNLALAMLVLGMVAVVKAVVVFSIISLIWLAIAALGFGLFVAFIHRAVVFSTWAADDLNATLRILKLYTDDDVIADKNERAAEKPENARK